MNRLRQTDSLGDALSAYKLAWFMELHRIAGTPLDPEEWVSRFLAGLTPREAWAAGADRD
jgi:hypothetical protein